MKRIRTALIVVGITLLIWVFAEGESLTTAPSTVDVALAEPSGFDARVIDPEDADSRLGISLTLRGSRAGIDSVKAQITDEILIDRAQGLPTTPGDHVIDIGAALRATEVFANTGVTIEDVDPEQITVRLTELVRLELPVVVDLDGEVEGPPQVSPERVEVWVPASMAPSAQDARVTAKVAPERLAGLELGVESTLTGVRLELPAGLKSVDGVRGPEPALASVTMTLRDTTSSAVIPQVPVQVLLATSELNRWRITIEDPWIENVTVRGPTELVQRVTRSGAEAQGRRVTVLAVLHLSFEELEQGITSKRVEFMLEPASAGSLQFEAPDRMVSFTVEPAADGEPEQPERE